MNIYMYWCTCGCLCLTACKFGCIERKRHVTSRYMYLQKSMPWHKRAHESTCIGIGHTYIYALPAMLHAYPLQKHAISPVLAVFRFACGQKSPSAVAGRVASWTFADWRGALRGGGVILQDVILPKVMVGDGKRVACQRIYFRNLIVLICFWWVCLCLTNLRKWFCRCSPTFVG